MNDDMRIRDVLNAPPAMAWADPAAQRSDAMDMGERRGSVQPSGDDGRIYRTDQGDGSGQHAPDWERSTTATAARPDAREATERFRANASPAPAGPDGSAGLSTADLAAPRKAPDGQDGSAGPGSVDRDADGRSGDAAGRRALLFGDGDANTFRQRWVEVQAAFVDDPQRAVQEGDALVAEVMQHLARVFSTEKERLESDWKQGRDAGTEDLRQAFQRYRSFFDRLLSL